MRMTTGRVFGSPDFAARPCQAARTRQKGGMDFDDQLRRYFGTADLAAIHPEAHAAGTERMRVDFGGRLEGFEEYSSDEQFAVAVARLADRAADEARRLAAMFSSLPDTAEILLEQARTEARQAPAHPGWMLYNAGVAAGLVGRSDEAAEMFGRVLNGSGDQTSVLHLKAGRMSNLTSDAAKLRQEAASTIAQQREALRLSPWDASQL